MQVGKTPHIVIVDDDADILDVLELLFAEDGYRTTPCSATQQALAILLDDPANLLITDLRLGGSDGLELIRQASALVNPLPSIILLTAGATPSDTESAELLRATNAKVIAKPFDVDQLSALVRSLV